MTMSRRYDGKVDDQTHYVTTHQANVDGFGFSEDPELALGDLPLEKRLVIVNGNIRAVWPKTFLGEGSFRLLVAGEGLREALVVGPGDSINLRDIVKNATRLSELAARPVVVSRQLARYPWH